MSSLLAVQLAVADTVVPRQHRVGKEMVLVGKPMRRHHNSNDLVGPYRAETGNAEELLAAGSLAALRERGGLRLEGKEYQVLDGDVINFRFNV